MAQISTRKSGRSGDERRKRMGRHLESSFCRVFLQVATPQNAATLRPRGTRAGATPLTHQKRSARTRGPVLAAGRWGARGLRWGQSSRGNFGCQCFSATERRLSQGGGGCWSRGWDWEEDTRCHSKQCPSLLRPGLELNGRALRLCGCSGGGGSWREG